MNNSLKARLLMLVCLSAIPAISAAQQLAYASKTVNMRAGPSRDYPVVATLAAGSSMTIHGCLSNYRWCDVEAGYYRGWVSGNHIVYPYLGENLTVLGYGPSFGLGIVTFNIGNYWDNYYTAYPWYPYHSNWVNRPWVGYGSGYGVGQNWRAPRATVRPVNPPVLPGVRPQVRPSTSLPPAQVRPVTPQRLPRAQVHGVTRSEIIGNPVNAQRRSERGGNQQRQIGRQPQSPPVDTR